MKNTSIEVDYDKLTIEINEKLGEAATALNKAVELAASAGVSFGNDYYDYDDAQQECVDNISYGELFKALRNAGWSTSSMNC